MRRIRDCASMSRIFDTASLKFYKIYAIYSCFRVMLVFYGTLEWEGYFEWNGDGK